MPRPLQFLTILSILLHLGLGCCWHQQHICQTDSQADSKSAHVSAGKCQHLGHGHQHSHSHSPPAKNSQPSEGEAPHSDCCQTTGCVTILSSVTDWSQFVSPSSVAFDSPTQPLDDALATRARPFAQSAPPGAIPLQIAYGILLL